MNYFYSLLLGFLNAFVCAHFAKKRGRNPYYWFISGALFGLLALGTLFLLPSRKKANAELKMALPQPPQLQALSPTQTSKFWYYLDQEKKQFGPMSFDGLARAWREGDLSAQNLVWNEELENWKPFDEVINIS